MPKPSKRDALRRSLKVVIDEADRPALEAAAEAMAEHAAYPDERDKILLIMADADITSKKFPDEQASAKAKRDAKRATHLNGVATRHEIDANLDLFRCAPATNDGLKNAGRAEHRNNGDTA